jgi:putative ABC transport system permease protein
MRQLRFAIRQLRLSPGFAIATILTMALGIGATTAMFSLINGVLLRPLPFPQSDRLLSLDYDDSAFGGNGQQTFSYANYFDFRSQNHSLNGLASYRQDHSTLVTPAGSQRIESEVVSSNFFSVLGVRPVLGRDFLPEDDKPGARVAMLSWEAWRSSFGGSPGVIGGSISLDGESYTVAGVMPAGFMFPIQARQTSVWTTLGIDFHAPAPRLAATGEIETVTVGGDGGLGAQRQAGVLDLIGRLKPGVSIAQAHADLDVIARNLSAQYPKENLQFTRTIVQSELDHLVGDTRPALRVLFAAVSSLLLIACVNVAGLLLARASRRRSEIAIRAALGADRGDIVRQILAESVVLSICGGALGIGLAVWIVRALPGFAPANLPRMDHVAIDAPVLIFAILISIASGILFGLLPAWRMSRLQPLDAVRDGSRSLAGSRAQQRLHGALIVAETAIGLVLLIGSGLLIRSFLHVLNVNPGFDAHQVLTVSMAPTNQYKRAQTQELYDRLAPRIAALPGVDAVAAGWPLPLSGNNVNIGLEIEGRPNAPGAEPAEYMAVATPGFFHALHIPVVSGREFSASDTTESAAVIIINQAFARKYFGDENPLGKKIKPGIGDGTFKNRMSEVIGVVGSVKRAGLTEETVPQYYLPWSQCLITWPTLTIRTAGDPLSIANAVRATVAEVDREIPVYGIKTLDNVMYTAASEPRFQTFLLTAFAGLALALAAIGLYGVLSYMVAQRSREIGVRIALGAQRGDVLGLIVRRGLRLAILGIAIGLAASTLLTGYMGKMLYGIQPSDPATFAVVSVILVVVSLAASGGPAWRATRVDPMNVLRDQ